MSIRKNWRPIRNKWCRLLRPYLDRHTFPPRSRKTVSTRRSLLVTNRRFSRMPLGMMFPNWEWVTVFSQIDISDVLWFHSRTLINPQRSQLLSWVQHRKALSNVINRTMRSFTNLTTLRIHLLTWITMRSRNTNEKWNKIRCENKVSRRQPNAKLTWRIDDSSILRSARKKNSLLDDIRKDILCSFECFRFRSDRRCLFRSLGSKHLQTRATNIAKTGVRPVTSVTCLEWLKHVFSFSLDLLGKSSLLSRERASFSWQFILRRQKSNNASAAMIWRRWCPC